MLLCCPCNDHPMFAFVPIAKYLFANPLPVSFEKLTRIFPSSSSSRCDTGVPIVLSSSRISFFPVPRNTCPSLAASQTIISFFSDRITVLPG